MASRKIAAPGSLARTEERRALAVRLHEARVGAGRTNAAAFARDVDVTPNTIYRMESGSVAPSVWVLQRLCEVSGVTMEWAVTGETRAPVELAEWLATDSGKRATPQAQAFLAALPLGKHRPTMIFYDLAFMAWERGLDPADAADAARMTSRLR